MVQGVDECLGVDGAVLLTAQEGAAEHIFQVALVDELYVTLLATDSPACDLLQNGSLGFVEQFGIGNADAVFLIDE